MKDEESLHAKLRKYLLTFENEFPNLVKVSRDFNFSQRTLNRRLKESNTSYSALLKSVKQFKSNQLLQNTRLTIQEIAFKVGYTDVSNFRKAYKAWQGMSPKEYRTKLT